jgi:hypothetical protein
MVHQRLYRAIAGGLLVEANVGNLVAGGIEREFILTICS